MAIANKAHTATARRIAKRYGATYNDKEGYDIETPEMIIEVETSATLADGVDRLKLLTQPVYVAVTNKESLPDALRLTNGTNVGVMDPKGNIEKESFKIPPDGFAAAGE